MDVSDIKDEHELLEKTKWLIGKTLREVSEKIHEEDKESRVTTKGRVGYLIEHGFFGIPKNSFDKPDIEHLGIEIKTCPLEFNKARDRLRVKEPLSLNIINYVEEDKNTDITQSSLYKKNRKILFILYIHDTEKERSEYVIKYVFLWEMNDQVLKELRPDYDIILAMIKKGDMHNFHQTLNNSLTLCPKHSGKFKDSHCRKSKRMQPHSDVCAEIRAFRFKNSYMNKITCRQIGKKLERGGWKVD